MPLALFQRMKGMITSEPAGPTDVRALGKDELHSPPGRPDLR
jgi:hypothetical protein